MRALVASLSVAVLSVALPASGAAHARPAALTGVHARAGGDLVAGATWGLVFRDDGAWSLGCAAAYGVDANVQDASLALDGAGVMVLGTYDGLFESRDGCTFDRGPAPLDEGWTVAVATATDGSVLAALSSVSQADQLYRRAVGGPWAPHGGPLERLVSDLVFDGETLWMTTFRPRTAAGPPAVFLERSDDGGLTFEAWELPVVDSEYGAHLLAARDGEVHLAVRHFEGEAVPERLLRFADDAFTQVHAMVQMEAGLWTEDGLWVIARAGGLDLAPDGVAFARIHDVAGRCLAAIDGELLACTDPARDGMALGAVTTDSVEPWLQLAELSALRACPAASEAAATCPMFREALAEDVQVPVDGVPPPGTALPDEGGCAVGGAEGAPGFGGALALAWVAQRRRRRKKSARPTKPAP